MLPHHAGLRPAWLLRLGLFLYDHIGGRHLLPPTRSVDLARDEVGKPLIAEPLQPAASNIPTASSTTPGSSCSTRATPPIAAPRSAPAPARSDIRQADGIWHVSMVDTLTGERSTDPGPRAGQCRRPLGRGRAGRGAGVNAKAKVRLVQGSHIVVRKLYDHDRAYMFQNADGRIVFVIPYQDDFTLIGTTDRDYDGDPAKVKATRRRDRISLRRRERVSRQAGDARGRGLDLFRRAAAL